MSFAYYNEIDPYAAQWLRNLIKEKLITDGEVDERPIQDVYPRDLACFTRCHFFAGIAGWDIALRLADFPTDRPVWTGSCPCQPFSTAGKRLQFADERHLWPYWFHLIGVCRPPVIFGEQVANGAGAWLDLVFADLESQDYAVGAAVLPAAGVGAPHVRNRNWFVAHADEARRPNSSGIAATQARADIRTAACMGDRAAPGPDADREGEHAVSLNGEMAQVSRPSFWSTESSVGCVADGIPRAMEQLRAYGNAIVPQAAAEFIKACRP